jgi:quercetin dioxygenase-like cupin family protein
MTRANGVKTFPELGVRAPGCGRAASATMDQQPRGDAHSNPALHRTASHQTTRSEDPMFQPSNRHAQSRVPSRSPRPAVAAVFAALLLAVSGCSAASPSEAQTASKATSAPTSTPVPSPEGSDSRAATHAPVVVEELGKGEQAGPVDVEVAGPTQVAFRRITIEPGAGTGEHCHDGQLVAVVEQGELTHYAPVYPTGVHVYKTGDSIVEGSGYVHQGVNEGSEPVVLLVTYVIAEGEPLAQTDLAQCDPVGTPIPVE